MKKICCLIALACFLFLPLIRTNDNSVSSSLAETTDNKLVLLYPVVGVTSSYNNFPRYNDTAKTHYGNDISAAEYTAVIASRAGTVVSLVSDSSAGNTIFIQDEQAPDVVYAYEHLSYWFVKRNDKVEAGDFIGTVGNTGNSTGSHLHFGALWKPSSSNYFNTSVYLNTNFIRKNGYIENAYQFNKNDRYDLSKITAYADCPYSIEYSSLKGADGLKIKYVYPKTYKISTAGWIVKGLVSSNVPISSVKVWIENLSGSQLFTPATKTFASDTYLFDLHQITSNIKFSKITAAGTYYYCMEAMDNAGRKCTVRQEFIASSTETISWCTAYYDGYSPEPEVPVGLAFTGIAYPTTYVINSNGYVWGEGSGAISSDSMMTITTQVYNSAGTLVDEAVFTPGTTSINLKTITGSIKVSKLTTPGYSTLRFIAKDAKERELRAAVSFNAVSSGSTASKTFSRSYQAPIQIKQLWRQNRQYTLYSSSYSWEQAQQYAESIGGSLVSVNDADEQSIVEELAASASQNIWIGARRDGGSWKWPDDGSMTYMNWSDGEPSNSGCVEDCAMLDKSSGKWHDVTESSISVGCFIVEMPEPSTSFHVEQKARTSSPHSTVCMVGDTVDVCLVASDGTSYLSDIQVSDTDIMEIEDGYESWWPLRVKKAGPVTITLIESGGENHHAVLELNAVSPTHSILAPDGICLTIGEVYWPLEAAAVMPALQPDERLTCSVYYGDEHISLSAEGALTGVTPGCACLLFETDDGAWTFLPITVTEASTFFEICSVGEAELLDQMAVGSDQELSYYLVLDDLLDVRSMSWSSSDETVLQIIAQNPETNSCTVRAVGEGDAYITLKAIFVMPLWKSETIQRYGQVDGLQSMLSVIPKERTEEWEAGYPISAVPSSEDPYVTSLSLSETAMTIETGKTKALTATVTPENAAVKTVVWTSEDPEIASVEDGLVCGIAEGSTTVWAACGGFKASCLVTVQEAKDPDAPLFTLSSGKAKAGERVTLSLDLSKNPGIAMTRLYLDYDSSVLTLEAAAVADLAKGFQVLLNDCDSATKQIYMYQTSNSSGDGAWLTLTFAVSAEAEEGKYPINLAYEPSETTDENGTEILCGTQNGLIVIQNVLTGDVNLDGTVNGKDVLKLARAIVGIESLTTQQRTAADVNGDETVNGKDVLKLARFIVGLEAALGKTTVTAAQVTAANTSAGVSLESKECTSGETVSLNLNIANNHGIAAAKFFITYDQAALKLVSIERTLLTNSWSVQQNAYETNGKQVFMYNTVNLTGDGALLKLTFEVDAAASGTYPITLSYSPADSCDENGQDVLLTVTDGQIVASAPIEPSIALNKTNMVLLKGNADSAFRQMLLMAAVVSEDPSPVLKWTSQNAQVATVKNGLVKAVGIGVTTITVMADNGLTASCAVRVVKDLPWLVLPTGLKEIRSEAFMDNASVEAILVPNGTTTIGARAFKNCTNLKIICIPSSVREIGADAFAGCGEVCLWCEKDSAGEAYAVKNNIDYCIRER